MINEITNLCMKKTNLNVMVGRRIIICDNSTFVFQIEHVNILKWGMRIAILLTYVNR